jgi:nucleotide-binding universal stress UspA family protein
MIIKNILVPVDGSDQSKKALEFGVDLAKRYAANLHLLHVVQPLVADDVFALGAVAVPVNASKDELDEAGNKVLEAAQDLAAEAGLEDVSSELEHGDPGRQIVAYAEQKGIDTIVMGTRGLGDFAGLLIGSVSHKVNHHAPCTCITVR